MPFSTEAQDFLFEVWSRNDRGWYHENKGRAKILIHEPFVRLMEDLRPSLLSIDPLIDTSQNRIARVYRDARVVGNGPFFRDHIWCTMGRGRDQMYGYPSFFFELSASDFRYGMGYYLPAKETLDAMRKMILSEDKAFLKAFKAHQKQKAFTLTGESYKRDHFPDAPEAYRDWLNRKTLCWIRESDDPNLLCDTSLSAIISKDFLSIAPIYTFLLKAESRWREPTGNPETGERNWN